MARAQDILKELTELGALGTYTAPKLVAPPALPRLRLPPPPLPSAPTRVVSSKRALPVEVRLAQMEESLREMLEWCAAMRAELMFPETASTESESFEEAEPLEEREADDSEPEESVNEGANVADDDAPAVDEGTEIDVLAVPTKPKLSLAELRARFLEPDALVLTQPVKVNGTLRTPVKEES